MKKFYNILVILVSFIFTISIWLIVISAYLDDLKKEDKDTLTTSNWNTIIEKLERYEEDLISNYRIQEELRLWVTPKYDNKETIWENKSHLGLNVNVYQYNNPELCYTDNNYEEVCLPMIYDDKTAGVFCDLVWGFYYDMYDKKWVSWQWDWKDWLYFKTNDHNNANRNDMLEIFYKFPEDSTWIDYVQCYTQDNIEDLIVLVDWYPSDSTLMTLKKPEDSEQTTLTHEDWNTLVTKVSELSPENLVYLYDMMWFKYPWAFCPEDFFTFHGLDRWEYQDGFYIAYTDPSFNHYHYFSDTLLLYKCSKDVFNRVEYSNILFCFNEGNEYNCDIDWEWGNYPDTVFRSLWTTQNPLIREYFCGTLHKNLDSAQDYWMTPFQYVSNSASVANLKNTIDTISIQKSNETGYPVFYNSDWNNYTKSLKCETIPQNSFEHY